MSERNAQRTSGSASSPSSASSAPPEQPMTSSTDVTPMMMLPAHEYKARMQAQVFADAEKIRSKETRPGGAFVVDGQWVDAEGRPLKEDAIPKEMRDTGDVEVKSASDDEIEAHKANQPTISNESPEARKVREQSA
jgi:hypothetical protein